MKAYVITVKGNKLAESAAQNCMDSHMKFANPFPIEIRTGVQPDQVDDMFVKLPFEWTYPWDQPRTDIKSGLKLSPYQTADKRKRMACFLSHWLLWTECIADDRPLLILEHDAIFIRPFFPQFTLDSKYGIIGINNPLGATRRADVFDSQVQTMRGEHLDVDRVLPVPSVDAFDVPQGLAGNSAYVIKPEGARELVKVVKEHGAWPNDAIMCKQLLPGILGVTSKYYTKVQGTRSTTTL